MYKEKLLSLHEQDKSLSLHGLEFLVVSALRDTELKTYETQVAVAEAFQELDRLHEATTGLTTFTQDPKLLSSYPRMSKPKAETFWGSWFEPFIAHRESLWGQETTTHGETA